MKEGKTHLETAANQPRLLFKPASWLAKIDFINHLILFNNVLITVLSERDGGKTSFSTLLQNNLDQQIKAISMTIKPPCDREVIINDIATQLHLINDAHTNLASVVAQVNERKAHVLLLIDDAQHLPESLIKEAMLAIKSQDDFGFFHLCLVSDYSVVATLNNLAVEPFNNLIHTIELGALNENETRTYVLQRAMAAHLINRPLTDTQFKEFYQQTKGNLAKINSNLEPFIFQCSTRKKTNKALLLKRTSLALIATAAIGGSYLYFDGIDTKGTVRDLNLASPAVKSVDYIASSSPNLAYSQQFPSQIPSWLDSSTRQLVHYALPKKQILEGMEDEQEHINTVALVDKVVVIPNIKIQNMAHEEQPNPPVSKVMESKLVAIRDNNAIKIPKKPILKLGKNRYTIQLVASHRLNDIHLFRKMNHLEGKTRVRHFTNAKGKWYILTLGEFTDRNRAQQDARKLPVQLTKLNPWIRPVSGLSNLG